MAEAKDIKFEIQVRSAGRWTIYTDSSTKLRAISEAKSLLGSGKFEAVKVTEDRGQMAEMIAFEEEAKARTVKDVTVTPVEDAPLCSNLAEFYGFQARITLGRVLRKYFDDVSLTPSEVLHNPYHIKALLRNEELVLQRA